MKTRITFLFFVLLILLFSGCTSTTEPTITTDSIPEKIVSVPKFESQPETFAKTITLEQFYTKMNFNPNGSAIEVVALSDPFGAIKAREIKNESTNLAFKLFPNHDPKDSVADAFRHAYFSFRLSQEIGTTRTKKFTDAYEISHINLPASRCMDLWNNLQGRLMYESTKNEKLDKKELAKREVLKAIRIKQLALKPIRTKSKK